MKIKQQKRTKNEIYGVTCKKMLKLWTSFWTRLDVRHIFQCVAPSRYKMTLPLGLREDNSPYNWLASYLYPWAWILVSRSTFWPRW